MPLVELPGFEEAVRRHAWKGERLPMLYDGDRVCSRCSSGIVVELSPYTADALFYGGGYGESQRVTAVVCLACGKSAVIRKESVRPQRRMQ